MENFIKGFWAAMFLVVFSSNAIASVLNIDFNGTQFNLGTFDSAESGADFYRYSTDFASSAAPKYPGTNDLIPLMADALQIFHM